MVWNMGLPVWLVLVWGPGGGTVVFLQLWLLVLPFTLFDIDLKVGSNDPWPRQILLSFAVKYI